MSPLVRGPVFQQEWGPEPGDGCAAAPAALPGAPPPPKSASTAEEVVHLTAQCGAAGADLVSTHYPAGPAPSSTQQAQHDKEGILEKRRQHVGPNVALFFADEPIHAVRGQGCELFDAEGNSYLDCINNVSHVGHAHPRVAAAVASQLAILNTNSRYLSQGLVDYAEQMAALMPSTLEVLYMTVSGSEANDLALRIAHAAARRAQAEDGDTRPLHIAVMDHAYHGHTSALIDLSPYKFNGPGGEGCPAHVHVLPCPDTYRGTNLDGAAAARAAIAAAKASGGRLAGFFSESIISCGGQVMLPEGYLAAVYSEMRAAGAVCVADEVQCGFGRVGRTFWAFELQDVIPDLVTFGKPCGNGFPMAGLVTSPELAAKFANGMEFFATFAGSNAAAACGLAVLDVMRDEGLQQNATDVGAHCLARLRELQAEFPDTVGDVRGEGLMLGLEIVSDAASRTPAPALAAHLKRHAKQQHRVLLSCEGPYNAVIKIKPPMCFNREQADVMVGALRSGLAVLSHAERAALVAEGLAEVAFVDQRHARLG